MAGRQATLPVYDLHPDIDEPEQEDIGKSSLASAEESTRIEKAPLRKSAVSTDSFMQHRSMPELVYQWAPTDLDTASITSESMLQHTTVNSKQGHLETGLRAHDSVTTALLASNPRTFDRIKAEPWGYGSMQSRYSILRMKTSSENDLRKHATVEFVLDHVHHRAAQSFHANPSSIRRAPRRLTSEEKAELYRIRPDLEIGPDPYLIGQVEELHRRNQRRFVFAMFGGFISVILLLVFFSMWERSSQ